MQPGRLKTLLKSAGRRKAVVLRAFCLMVDEGDGDKLGEWELDSPTEEARDELVAEIWNAVQNDCDVRGEPAKYRIRMTGSGGEEIKSWTMKQLPDPAAARGDEASTHDDAPNAAGLVALALRHSEQSVQLMISTHTQATKMLQGQLESAHKEIALLRKRETEVMDLARSISMRLSEGRDDERAGERIDRGIALLARFVSAAGQELGALPKGFDPLSELVGGYAAEVVGGSRDGE